MLALLLIFVCSPMRSCRHVRVHGFQCFIVLKQQYDNEQAGMVTV